MTCEGATFAGNVGASLLRAIGVSELVATSWSGYESLALQLATDAKLLAEIRQKLARNRDSFPLFDIERFRQHIEAAYVRMWERCQRGEPPASFAVPPISSSTAR